MSESQEQARLPTGESDYTLRTSILPSPFHLGVNYEGAILEGSLRVSPAKVIEKVHVDKLDGHEVLQLVQHGKTGRGGLVYRFRAKTDRPIKFLAFVGLWTDLGKTSTHFSLEVKPGSPPGGRIFFCESLFSAYSDHWTHANLNLITRELKVQANTADTLPADLSPFHTVILHAGGLRFLVRDERKEIHRYLVSGGRVIVLANHFYRDTVMLANHLTEPYGIHLEDRECGELMCDLQCNRQHIEDHSTMKGVRQLRWFRPSPMTVTNQARLLVHNPERPEEGFVACGGPNQNLVAIGCSLLHSLVCQGWPYDNGQLLANLLMKN